MASTVADVMVATLKASGVQRVYGLPGDSLNGFTDALRRDGGITWEHVRHEEAAAFAAAGEAALTGELAVCAALQRGGVAVVVVPGEVFLADAPHSTQPARVRAVSPVMRPDEESLAAAAQVLNGASRVTILAGAGCADAHDQLIVLAEALKAPVVHAFRGKEFVEYDNPYDVGMTGLIGFGSGYRAMEHCDALVMLGTDFPYRQFYPEGVPVIQVDVRGERIGRRVPVEVPLVGTVKDTVDALLPLITVKPASAHLDRMTAHYRRARGRMDKLARDRQNDSPLHPQFVAATINRVAADDAVFTADVGTPCIWAARYLRMNGRRRLIGSFNHGSMANALPHAIGAQASQPGRQVVALSGDGGLAMLLGELITLRQQRLPVKVVVFNNGALSFVELEMKAAGIVTYGTDLDNPDFAGMARSAGLFGIRVDKAGELEGALTEAFGHDGPALIDVRTAQHELSLPPKLSYGEIKGFTLYARPGRSCPAEAKSSSSWPRRTCVSWTSIDILPLLKAGLPATTPDGAAVEVRGSRAGQPGRLPASEGGWEPPLSRMPHESRAPRSREPESRSARSGNDNDGPLLSFQQQRWSIVAVRPRRQGQ